MNCFFRNKRPRPLSDKKIRLALEADISSGSEDERFRLSDDSDLYKDYRPPNYAKSEMDIECLDQDDSDEFEQITLTIVVNHSMTDETTVESESSSRWSKMTRKIWQCASKPCGTLE